MRSRSTLTALALLTSATLVACGGGGSGTSAESEVGAATSGGDEATTLTVTAKDDITFASTELTAAAGDIDVSITCGSAVNHDVAIEGQNGDAPVAVCGAGETGHGSINLPAGTYTFYCAVPGHRGTMEGTLTVA